MNSYIHELYLTTICVSLQTILVSHIMFPANDWGHCDRYDTPPCLTKMCFLAMSVSGLNSSSYF